VIAIELSFRTRALADEVQEKRKKELSNSEFFILMIV